MSTRVNRPLPVAPRRLALLRRVRAVALVVVAGWLLPALAWADNFVKFEGKAPEEIPAGKFIAGAYGFIWVAVLVYVVFVARGLARTNAEVAELRRKLDGGAPRA